MANYTVRTRHHEYAHHIKRWKKIRNALSGDCAQYLRDVGKNESDASYGKARQAEYVDGAVFYNFTKRTLSGMVGAVMRKPPEIELPDSMKGLLDNVDGSGVGLIQHSQDTLKEIDSIGRGGLLTDAPNTEIANRAMQNKGELNPTIGFYTAENIISWRTHLVGSVVKLCMIVLRERYEYTPEGGDEFTWYHAEQYRVLDFDENGYYRQRVYKFNDNGDEVLNDGENFQLLEPKRGNGERFNYIPFEFIGSDNNDSTVDDSPMYPLCELNIGHYRNSADNEESSFVVGQPTLMLALGESMDIDSFEKFNPNGIKLGARKGHNLGAGGNAFLVQAESNNLAKENMRNKEEQAVQIGAQLISPTTQITAESARLQRGADTSVMSTIADNVSEAYTKSLQHVADMMGLGDSEMDKISFKLNTEFFLQQMTAQDRAAWMVDINAGLLPMRSYWSALRKAGQTDWTDEEIEDGLSNQPIVSSTDVTGDIPSSPTEE